MRAAMIGDNCIDFYVTIDGQEVNRRYPTGNCVDTGAKAMSSSSKTMCSMTPSM